MKLWWKVILGVVVVIVILFVTMALGFSYPVTESEIGEQFITANPVDVSQVVGFSQFRSCVGHDYRGPMVETGEVETTPRSLKHYVKVKPEYRGTRDAVAIFAPFNGKVFQIDNDRGGSGDQQVWLTPDSNNPASPRQWQFVFFHVSLDPALKEGSRVTAGQKIGTANLARGPERATDNFDIAMKFTRPMHRPAIDAVFHHMTPAVLAEYSAYGVTPEDLILAEEYRDTNDCPQLPQPPSGPEYDPETIYFPPNAGSNEYIFLQAP